MCVGIILHSCKTEEPGNDADWASPDQAELDGETDPFDAPIDSLTDPSVDEDATSDASPGPRFVALPDCLVVDSQTGCAESPIMQDWTCPEGWFAETVEEGLSWEYQICSAPERVLCEDGWAQFAGDESCRQVGTECPAEGSRFHTEADIRALVDDLDGRIIYVDVEGGEGGDGTLDAPYNAPGQAIDAGINRADIVVLAPGTYETRIVITDADSVENGFALIGSCVASTVISQDVTGPLVFFGSVAPAVVGNFTLVGGDNALHVTDTTAPVVLRSIVTNNAGQDAFRLNEMASISLIDVVSRTSENGIVVSDSDHVEFERVAVEGHTLVGIRISASTDVSLTDVVAVDNTRGLLLGADQEQEMTVTNLVAVRNQTGFVIGSGIAAVSNAHVAFSHLAPGDGIGFFVDEPAQLILNQALVEDNENTGILSEGTLVLSDVFIRGCATEEPQDVHQVGLHSVGDRMDVTRTTVAGNHHGVVLRVGEGHLSDCVVAGQGVHGVRVRDGGNLHLARSVIRNNGASGVSLVGSTLILEDVIIVNNVSDEALELYTHEAGIHSSTSDVSGTRIVLSDNGGMSLSLWLGSLELRDSIVQVGRSYPRTHPVHPGEGGFGIVALPAHGLLIENTLFSRNRSVAVAINGGEAFDDGTEDCFNGIDDDDNGQIDCDDRTCVSEDACRAQNPLTLQNVIIADTLLARCGELPPTNPESCVDRGDNRGGGMAIVVQNLASVEISNFDITGSARVGVVIGEDASIIGHNGEIHDNQTGVGVLNPDYDPTNLFDEVYIYDNDVDVQLGGIAIPDPSDVWDID